MTDLPHALRNLRHLYEQLLTSGIGSQPAAAKGLLGPAIEVVERVETEVQRLDGELAKARSERDEARHAGGIIKWADDTRLSIKIADERDTARAEVSRLTAELARRDGLDCNDDSLSIEDHLRAHVERQGKELRAERAEGSRLKAGLVAMRENWRRFDVRIAADIDALIGKEST